MTYRAWPAVFQWPRSGRRSGKPLACCLGQFFSDHGMDGGRENLSRVHSSFSDYGIHFLDSVIVWLLLCHKVAKLTLIPSWDWRRKGDGPGPRELSSMSVRDTKLNVCERHKTGRKWDGLGPRDLSSWRENLVTRADYPLSRTAAKIW